MCYVKEPIRGFYLDKINKNKKIERNARAEDDAAISKKNFIKASLDNVRNLYNIPTARYILIASFLKNFGGMIVSSFLPIFFGSNFP